jgi:hypothetical protein
MNLLRLRHGRRRALPNSPRVETARSRGSSGFLPFLRSPRGPSLRKGIQMQRILVCTLCGSERHQWVNPRLSTLLVLMARDVRYSVEFEWIVDSQRVEHARNLAVSKARSANVDALLMLDNDVAPTFNPLDLVAMAGDVVTTGMAFHLDQGTRLMHECVCCVLIRACVWQKISPPWFKWTTGNDELLSPAGGQGEDIYFLKLCQENGIKIHTAPALASHFHSCDITAIAAAKQAASAQQMQRPFTASDLVLRGVGR